MRARWKLIGLAGLAGVATTGVLLARKRRAQREYQPDQLREQLHHRLAEVSTDRTDPAARPDDRHAPAIDDRHA